jgi:endoglycosylceramidase
MNKKYRLLMLALSLLVLTLGFRKANAQPKFPEFPFHTAGKFMADSTGRVVMFHGVNMVNKLPPYTPAAAGFGEVDAKLIADAGWNVVRVGVLYSGVEPSPGTYDEPYLNRIAETVDLLGKYGVFFPLGFSPGSLRTGFLGRRPASLGNSDRRLAAST